MVAETLTLLRLPSEIRNLIYAMVLPTENGIKMTGPQLHKIKLGQLSRKPGALVPSLPILLVNRQIHREAAWLLYHNVRLMFNTGTGITSFLDIIGPRNASLLRNIIVLVDSFAIENEAVVECIADTLATPRLPPRITIETSPGTFGPENRNFWVCGPKANLLELLCQVFAGLQATASDRAWKVFARKDIIPLDANPDVSTVIVLVLVADEPEQADGLETDLGDLIGKLIDGDEDVLNDLRRVRRQDFVFQQLDRLGIEYLQDK
jgi:hypothetical protein